MGLLSRTAHALIVVDVQEGFRSYEVFDDVALSCSKLLAGRAHPRAAA